MGMYTQVKGYLNVDSIGFETVGLAQARLNEAKLSFLKDDTINCSRKAIVTGDTFLHVGFNASAFIFIGTEFKNYCRDAEAWLDYLLKYFPNAEGRVDFQYEEDECATSRIIARGEIVRQEEVGVKTEGYGNSFND